MSEIKNIEKNSISVETENKICEISAKPNSSMVIHDENAQDSIDFQRKKLLQYEKMNNRTPVIPLKRSSMFFNQSVMSPMSELAENLIQAKLHETAGDKIKNNGKCLLRLKNLFNHFILLIFVLMYQQNG